MITALLVDDEPRAVTRLAGLLEQSAAVEVIGTASSVDDAERFLAGRVPDVVFLDIDMPGRLGVDLVASIPAGTKLVFVTAHEGHAVDAFRHGAVDYVLKPFDEDRLAITLGRLGAIPADRPATPERPAPAAAKAHHDEPPPAVPPDTVRISLDAGRTTVLVPLRDVAWIESVQNYTRVQAAGRRPGTMRRTMQEWADLLATSSDFQRLGRSLIVRLSALRSTQWQSRDQTLLSFTGVDDPLPVGRTAAARLRELLDRG
ncbi:MAG: LytR/AlgR family response regulator transcription factor [Planctomycetaceae bacterium]